ncbi:MAG: two-component regulator propeller domain-containing protein [Gammaproteobacteria bacterium]
MRSSIALMRVVLLVAAVLSARVGPASASELTFRPIGENRGLDVAVGSALLFDQRGFLWVGSRDGLHRYDGYRATLFSPDITDPHAITDLDIRALYETRDGMIWVATNTGGLNRLDPRTGRFLAWRHVSGDPDSLSHDSIYGMAEDASGDLWVGTQIGLNRLDRETGTFTRYLSDPDDPRSLSHDYVYALLLDRGGVLWVATVGGGLSRYNAASDDFTRFDLAALTGGPADCNDVFAIGEDPAGNLWLGTRGGLIRFNPARTELEPVDLSGSGAGQPAITTMVLDERGSLWLGTLISGILHYDPDRQASRAYTGYDEYDADGLAAQPQLSLALRDNALYVGTWGAGLWKARIPDTHFLHLGTDRETSGLLYPAVTAVLGGAEPGKPWVGTFGGGPQPADVREGTFAAPFDPSSELRVDGVLSFARAADGTLFVGTNHGLWELGPDREIRNFFQFRPGEDAGLGEGYVTSLHLQPDGSLWVGVGGSGLYRLDADGSAFTAFRHDAARPDSLSGDYITAIVGAGEGELWVGTRSSGLNLCRTEPWSCRRFGVGPGADGGLGHFHVTALYRDRRGRLWVGTDGGGLHQVRRSPDGAVTGFRRWSEADGLVSNAIMAIAEDDDGSLWLSTRQGLTRLDPDQGRVANYVEQSGLPVTHFNSNAAGSDARYIYFGSVDGLLVVPRGRPLTTRQPSATRITAVEQIGSADYRPATGWVPERIRVDYGSMLGIEFASLDFAELPHRYEFRLRAEDDWTPIGQRTQVTLLDLSPGTYRFAARGRDVFGLWSTSPALQIDVVPPFWMTAWFRLLVVLAVLAGAIGLHRLRTRRLEMRALEMQRLGALREQALERVLGDRSELAELTPRQKEVLQLIAEGHTTREIAERLGVSVKTVETHRANLMERLDIRDIPGLVRLAIRAGLISPHD